MYSNRAVGVCRATEGEGYVEQQRGRGMYSGRKRNLDTSKTKENICG